MSATNGIMAEEINQVGSNKRMRKQTDRVTASNSQYTPAPKKARSTSSSSTTTSKAQAHHVSIAPIYETKVLPSVALSQFDKASQLVLSHDQLICCGCEVNSENYASIVTTFT